MKASENMLDRQMIKTRFKNSDMDFQFNWSLGVSAILGLSPSQVFLAASEVKDGNPESWVEAFRRLGDAEALRAGKSERVGSGAETGTAWLGAAYAYRSAVQFADVQSGGFRELVKVMEKCFQTGVRIVGAPVRTVEIPFEGKSLPGYYLEHDTEPRPVMIMVGGGDTFREDLFYFAGYAGWKRGYNVLMVDLPGQGLTPDLGFTFRVNMYAPQKAFIDWLAARKTCRMDGSLSMESQEGATSQHSAPRVQCRGYRRDRGHTDF